MSHNVLGIIGGGQLALFIAQAAQKHALKFHIHAQSSEEPAALAFTEYCSFGAMGDVHALQDSLGHCTHIALESEFWSPADLQAALGAKKFCPRLSGYELVYGKIQQRHLMSRLEIAQPQYRVVHNEAELKRAFEILGRDVIIKCSTGGYDGTGNRHAERFEDALKAAKFFDMNSQHPVLIEKRLLLTRELALTFFATDEDTTFFPPVETIQDGHICTTAISPANLAVAERERLEGAAKLLITHGLRGLYTIEFFREERGPWCYNEIAPRPHNSQHISMDNCSLSQYDAIIQWVMGQKLPERVVVTGDAAMVNILGKNDALAQPLSLPEIGIDVEVRTYMYGKKQSRQGRKLGHLTLLGPRDRILVEAKRMSREYKI